MKETILKILAGIFLMIFFFVSGLFIGCKTLTVHVDKEIPSCGTAYTVLDALVKSGAKDYTLAAKPVDKCIEERDAKFKLDQQILKQNDCRKQYFGDKVIDVTNYPVYIKYLECTK